MFSVKTSFWAKNLQQKQYYNETVKPKTSTSNPHWRECAITLRSQNLYLKLPLTGTCYHALAIDCPIGIPKETNVAWFKLSIKFGGSVTINLCVWSSSPRIITESHWALRSGPLPPPSDEQQKKTNNGKWHKHALQDLFLHLYLAVTEHDFLALPREGGVWEWEAPSHLFSSLNTRLFKG